MKEKARRAAILLGAILLVLLVYMVYDSMRPRTQAEKLAAIIHREDRRLLDSELLSYLEDTDFVVRARAALSVGRIGGERAAKALFDLLDDTSLDVASSAAFGIGLSGDKKSAFPLIDYALDLPSSVTAEAVLAAGRLADSTMTDVQASIAGFLSHPAPDVREAACYALFYAGAKRQIAALPSFVTSETDSLARIAALYALARSGSPDGMPVYLEFVASGDPYVRSLALRGMGSVKSTDAVRYLSIGLNDDNENVVAQAIASLSRQEASVSAKPLAAKLIGCDDSKLIGALLDALRGLKSAEGVAAAEGLLRGSLSETVITSALLYLTSVRGDRMVTVIDSILVGMPSPELRAACARSFGLINKSSVIARLAVLYGDEDPTVRAAAFSELTRIDSTNVDFYLKKSLNDPDFVPVVLAVDKIGEKKKTEYLPTFATYMEAGSDVDVDIRRSIVAAVRSFLEAGHDDSTLFGILMSGALDRNYIVRGEAAAVFEEVLDRKDLRVQESNATIIDEDDIAEAIEKYRVNPYARVETDRGEFEIELYFDVAPLTVLNFIDLVESDFYDGLRFHRVVPNFVVQGGDPRGDGWGGPPYFIRCEYSQERYIRGTVGIATSGRDTGGSQFFVTHSPQPHLDARYTISGQVLEGIETIDRIERGDLIHDIKIVENK